MKIITALFLTLVSLNVFSAVVTLGELGVNTVVETEGESAGTVSLISLAKAQSIADSLSDAAALKMYHYGDPNQEVTPDAAFGFDSNSGYITNYVELIGGINVVVPYQIRGIPVVGIGTGAFLSQRYTSSITNVILPKCVSVLGGNSFYGCTNLISVSASGVVEIQTGTFDLCSSLKKISLSVCTTLRTYAFFGCKSLCEIYVPNLNLIQSKAFMKCYSLTEIDLRNVVGIGSYAFSGCTNLLSVTWGSLNPVEQSTSIYDLSNAQNFGSANLVTNYVVNPNMEGWTNSFNGRPVVRGSVSADDFFLGGDSLSERLSSATNWIADHNSDTNDTAHTALFASKANVETVVSGDVGTAYAGSRYFWASGTNVILRVSMTGGQVINYASLRNTATNSITAIAESSGWKWTGGAMTNTIPAGRMMTFGWSCNPSTGTTNAFATGASVN